jgi:hypothetical protein
MDDWYGPVNSGKYCPCQPFDPESYLLLLLKLTLYIVISEIKSQPDCEKEGGIQRGHFNEHRTQSAEMMEGTLVIARGVDGTTSSSQHVIE